MKIFFAFTAVAVVALLSIIAYDGSLGLPSKVNEVRCDSLLTQRLFYSQLLRKSDDLENLADKVDSAGTIGQLNKLVTSGSNIAAKRTLWFKSNREPSSCQAQVYLQTLNKDGDNTAYIGFSINGFVPTDSKNASVLESINLDWLNVQWFKE